MTENIDLYELNNTFQRRLKNYLRHDFCLPVAFLPGVDLSYVKNLHPVVMWKLPYNMEEDLLDFAASFFQLVYNTVLYGKSEEIINPEYEDLLNSFLNYIHKNQKDTWIENLAGIFASKRILCDKIYVLSACTANLNKNLKLEKYYASFLSGDSFEKHYYINFKQRRFVRERDLLSIQDRYAYLLNRGQVFKAVMLLRREGRSEMSEKEINSIVLDLYLKNGKYWNFLSVLKKCNTIPYSEVIYETVYCIRKLGLKEMEDEIVMSFVKDKNFLPYYYEKFKQVMDQENPGAQSFVLFPSRIRHLLYLHNNPLSSLLSLVKNNPDRIDFFAIKISQMDLVQFANLNILNSLAGKNQFIRRYLALYFDSQKLHDRAIGIMQNMNTSDSYLRYRRGMNYIYTGRLMEALRDFEWLVRKYPGNAKLWMNYGKLLSSLRRNSESQQAENVARSINQGLLKSQV
ncbi:MAG: hypothetical protein OEZ34_02665 [Spirochaetia bacterium]|nr:hypothetical protein [Spirochaetia bacterium]